MGQARLRGSFEERKAQALAEGRDKETVRKQRERAKAGNLFVDINAIPMSVNEQAKELVSVDASNMALSMALMASMLHRRRRRRINYEAGLGVVTQLEDK